MRLEIPDNDLPLFLSLLGLGLLHAIARGSLPSDAGIWVLGVPRIWQPLVERGEVLREIAAVYSEMDELSALQELAPDRYHERLEALMVRLVANLRYRDGWGVRWVTDDRTTRADEGLLPGRIDGTESAED